VRRYACIRSDLLKNSPNSKRPKTNPISSLLILLPSSHPCPCPQCPLHTRRRTCCDQPPRAGEPEDRPRHRCHPQLAVYHLSSSCPPSRAGAATPSLSSVLLQISATAGCCDEEWRNGGSGRSYWRGNGMTCSHTPGRGRLRLAPPTGRCPPLDGVPGLLGSKPSDTTTTKVRGFGGHPLGAKMARSSISFVPRSSISLQRANCCSTSISIS
jgi:hypothetical protein